MIVGVIFDRLLFDNPIWTFAGVILIVITGNLLINYPEKALSKYGIDEKTISIMKIVLMVLFFFIACIIAATLIKY